MADGQYVLYPTMLFDGDCSFCQHWIKKLQLITREKVHYRPFQKALVRFPQVTEEECRESVRLILPDGSVSSGAHAVLKAFDVSDRYTWLLKCYERVPLFARILEWGYRLVARHRFFLSKFYRLPQCRV